MQRFFTATLMLIVVFSGAYSIREVNRGTCVRQVAGEKLDFDWGFMSGSFTPSKCEKRIWE